MSTDVTLPRGTAARFPGQCLICSAATEHRLKIRSHQAPYLLVPWRADRTLQVPVCEGCSGRFRRGRVLRLVTLVVVVVIAVVGASTLLNKMERGFLRGTLLLLVAVLLALPWALWHVLAPPPFDYTIWHDRIDYEFQDEGYALAFKALNGPAAPGEAADELEAWEEPPG